MRPGALAVLLLAASCSSPAVRPDPAPAQASQHRAVNPLVEEEGSEDGLKVEGSLGTMDEDAIQAGMAPGLQEVSRCFQRQVKTEPYLGGQISLHFRVGRDGSTQRVRLSESSLGSLAAERCILAAVARSRFARPRGGEAEFNYPLTFQGQVATVRWDVSIVKDRLLAKVEDLLRPRSGGPPLKAPDGLIVTFYVDTRGAVVSAGLTADDPISPEFGDRFVENLKQLRFDPPQGGIAKVIYSW